MTKDCELDEIERAEGLAREGQAPILSPSDRAMVRRLDEALSWLWVVDQRQRATAATLAQLRAENARLRRAIVRLAKLQPERVRRAVMEVINNA
jgi:hypothetical protein